MLTIISFIYLQITTFQFQLGDILFQDCNCGAMCDAIEEVTSSAQNARFSHVAIVTGNEKNGYDVIEANIYGVKKVKLIDFLQRYTDSNGNPKVAVGRLKKDKNYLISKALYYIEKQIGFPYDSVFLLNNNAFYCSELIYEGFKYANDGKDFFSLFPMTFKIPNSTGFHHAFEAYYHSINSQIPEGELGLNPGSISRDKFLDVTFLYKLNDSGH